VSSSIAKSPQRLGSVRMSLPRLDRWGHPAAVT
jgi:hypothetical protein